MAKRGWSLTDAQLTSLKESYGEHKRRQKLNPAARSAQAPRSQKRSVKPKPVSRPSPDRLRERRGSIDFYRRQTYMQPDLASLNTKQAQKTRHVTTPRARGGAYATSPSQAHLIPDRQSTSSALRDPQRVATRRQASTQAAYRAADASMYNSTVTPKAKPVEDKPSWSRRSPDQNVFW